MAKAGRPKIKLDEEQLKNLAGIGCTMEEIASFFKVSKDTLERNYAAILREGREQGKMSVRRMLWKHGNNGNPTALKYLIHNKLKERIEDPIQIRLMGEEIAQMSDSELDAILKENK